MVVKVDTCKQVQRCEVVKGAAARRAQDTQNPATLRLTFAQTLNPNPHPYPAYSVAANDMWSAMPMSNAWGWDCLYGKRDQSCMSVNN